jgi:hypothetical protein
MSFAAAFLRIRAEGELPAGSRYTFDIQQVVDSVPVGGSAFVVPIEGAPEYPPAFRFPFDMDGSDPTEWDRIERESEEDKFLPPLATDIVREREAELEK